MTWIEHQSKSTEVCFLKISSIDWKVIYSLYRLQRDFLTGSTKDKRNVLGINSGKSNVYKFSEIDI